MESEYNTEGAARPSGRGFAIMSHLGWVVFWLSFIIGWPAAAVTAFLRSIGQDVRADFFGGIAQAALVMAVGAIALGLVILVMRDARHG